MAGDIVRIAYGTSKGAVITLTKYIAVQHGRQGIRCNAIAPGVIMTEAMKGLPVLAETIKRHVVTPRLGEPSRSEEHTSELQSLMRISYAVFCLKTKHKNNKNYFA